MHDSCILRDSHLLQQIEEMMPVNGVIYDLYGDLAYPQSLLPFVGFWHPGASNIEALWNLLMSKSREVVEWGSTHVIGNWKYLDFWATMNTFEVPVAKYYLVGSFLASLRSTFSDN